MTLPAKRANRSNTVVSRERFLDAAAKLYVGLGYGSCTIRLIAKDAKTSLACLNRHWEGKAQLFEDVFARHFGEVHAAQEAALEGVAATLHDDSRAALVEIIRAVFDPVFAEQPDGSIAVGRRVYCLALVDPTPEVRRIIRNLTSSNLALILNMLRQIMPSASLETFMTIRSVVFGTYLHSQLFREELTSSLGPSERIDWTKTVDIVANLFINGFPLEHSVSTRQA